MEEEFGEDVEYDLIGWTTKKKVLQQMMCILNLLLIKIPPFGRGGNLNTIIGSNPPINLNHGNIANIILTFINNKTDGLTVCAAVALEDEAGLGYIVLQEVRTRFCRPHPPSMRGG